MEVRLDGPDDPRTVDYRAVPDPELLRRRGLFVVEGRLPVRRVLQDGRFVVRSLLVSEAARRALAPEFARLADEIPVYVCPLDTFRELTGFDLHRGCLALAERPSPADAAALLAEARLVVVLEAVTDPDNVGGIFRNAAAFGVDAVLLSPTCSDPFYRKAVRTSMAASLRVPFARLEPWPEELQHLRDAGFSLVALTPREPSVALTALAARRPARVALILGAEGSGLTPAVEAAADLRVRIPIRPEVDSLNIAVAAGIALWATSGLTDGRSG